MDTPKSPSLPFINNRENISTRIDSVSYAGVGGSQAFENNSLNKLKPGQISNRLFGCLSPSQSKELLHQEKLQENYNTKETEKNIFLDTSIEFMIGKLENGKRPQVIS